VLPNLIVIGAAKCGTTSLHEYLDEHPDVAMSREKELNFFVEEKNWPRGIAWYESQFDADVPVRGESSPTYTAYPEYHGVPERIRSVVPEAKLVYLVRDPIDRIVSHYLHRTTVRPQPLPDALATDHLRERLVAVSRYWLQLSRYLEHFSEEQILVVDSGELRRDRAGTMRRIFGFAGADPDFTSKAFERSHNRAIGQTRKTRGGHAIVRVLERTLGPTMAQRVRQRAPAAVRAPFVYDVRRPEPDEEWRERLAEELGDDLERLRAYTRLAFAGWSL
jgi:sulfotransferase family protein